MNKIYKVKFSMSIEVMAEYEEEAVEFAREKLLEGNGHYVHDYMNLESVKEQKNK